jgi:hypothetical protein
MAEAEIEPRIWAAKRQIALGIGRAPTRTMSSVTAGLKSPPEIRKKIQTLTMGEKPKMMEM